MIKGLFYIVTASVLLFSSTHAQQPLLTLDAAIGTALKNNYDIQLSKSDSLIAALDYSYRNAAFYPRLNATAGLLHNNNAQRQTLADGTKRSSKGIQSNNINGSVNLNWTLYDGMKMFVTRQRALELVHLGELQFKNQVQATVANIITLYYGITREKQQLKAIDEQIIIYRTRLEHAEKKLQIGSGNKADVLQSKVDLNAQLAARLRQITAIDQLKISLNQAMNSGEQYSRQTNYDVADSIPVATRLTAPQLMANFSSPELEIINKNISIGELIVKERRAERLPVISFNSAYNFNRTNNQKVINQFSPLFNQALGFNYGLTATIPIFNNYNVKRQIEQASLNVKLLQLEYDTRASYIKLGLEQAYRNYLLQLQLLELEESNIALARENVNIAMEVYKLSAATVFQLREAQISLENAYNRLIEARYNAKIAETEYIRLKGELLQ